MDLCLRYLVLGVVGITMSACTSIEGGNCADDTDGSQWYFITQTGATGTLKKCVRCNFSVDPNDVPDWIEDNAGEDYLASNPTFVDVLPCVYIYGPGPYETDVQCAALACSESAVTNDAVREDHHAGRTIIKEREDDE